MKKIFFLTLISFLIFALNSCENDGEFHNEENSFTLKSKATIDNNIVLPVGTKWHYSDENHSGVEFELPSGYQFLLLNNETKRVSLQTIAAGYSCTCYGGGSCTTFYNEDVGYGCLHNNCSGSCTDKNTKALSNIEIMGVLYTDNDMIEFSPKHKASLSEKGKDLIFSNVVFQTKIKDVYDLFYKHIEKPNFSDPNLLKNIDQASFKFVKGYLFGVELGMLLPNDTTNDIFKNMSIAPIDAPKSCSCSGSGSGCSLQKQGAFGYVAYYCNGCSTCTMN